MTTAEAAADNEVELQIKVSEKSGVKAYGFAYDGKAVIMNRGTGKFKAIKNQTKLLEWGMLGDPGGTMKVEVLRDKTAICTRAKSKIVPPFEQGLDAFEIKVS